MKKFIAAVMVAAMSLSVGVTGFASPFADINQVPWQGAQTYVDKAFSIGIMMGDTNSKGQRVFRAKDGVTYCESTQIIYSLMKTLALADGTSHVSKWSAVMKQYNIPQWAQQSIAYCLEEGYVSQAEVAMFMTGSKSNSASREKVATFLGRAINNSGKLGSVSSTKLNFTDTANVSAADAPFIQFLVENSIISGDGKGKFNPSKSINRAEMATIISRAYDSMKDSKKVAEKSSFVTGEITDISSSHVSIHPKQGSEKRYDFADKDDLTCRYDGKKVSLSTITSHFNKGEYLWSELSLNKDGEVVTIQASDDSAHKVLKGDVYSVSSSKIVIKKDGHKYTYELEDSDDLYIRIDGETKTMSALKSYVNKEDVYVELSLDDDDYVKRIIAKTGRSESEDTEKGIIVRLNGDKITLRKDNKNKDYRFEDVDDTYFKIDGDRSDYRHLKRLFDDEDSIHATLTLNRSGKIVKVVAYGDYNEESTTVSGEVTDISSTKIWISTSRSTVRYKFSDDVDFNIDGRVDTDERYIRQLLDEDYRIDATIKVVDNEVIKVNATSTSPARPEKETTAEYDGIVLGATTASITIQTRTNNVTFEYTGDTIIKVDNQKISASEFADNLRAGYDISAEVIGTSKGRAISVNATSSGSGSETNGIVEGMVENITTSAVTMRVAGESYKYKYTEDCEMYFGDMEITAEEMIAFESYAAVHAKVTLNRNVAATRIDFSEEK